VLSADAKTQLLLSIPRSWLAELDLYVPETGDIEIRQIRGEPAAQRAAANQVNG
jgi:hypothetical protein